MATSRVFPFVPKSNRFLEPGDFFGMPLPNDRWACGVVLGNLRKKRMAFIGGLFNWVGDEPPSCESVSGSDIPHFTVHHVKTISNYGLTIDGNCPVDQSDLGLRRNVFDVYRGGLFDHNREGMKQDRSTPAMHATSPGGLYARAIRLYGGMGDTEEIRLYLGSLRESLAQMN